METLLFWALGWAIAVAAPISPSQAPAAAVETKKAGGEDVTLRGVDKTKAYTLEFAADGSPVLTLTKVSTLGPAPPAPPLPPAPPVPTDLTIRAKAILAEASKVGDPANAKNLAEVYRQVARLGRDGTVNDAATLQAMTKYATDTLLGPVKAPAWQKTRDVLAVQWSQVPAGSRVTDYCTLLEEAASGLDAVDTNKGISPEMKKWIMEVLIPLLFKLFLGG